MLRRDDDDKVETMYSKTSSKTSITAGSFTAYDQLRAAKGKLAVAS